MASKDTDPSSALIPKLFVYHFNGFVIWATKNVHKPAFENPARVQNFPLYHHIELGSNENQNKDFFPRATESSNLH